MVHPLAQNEPAMAYDAATGTAVLFGGYSEPYNGIFRFPTATWTWG